MFSLWSHILYIYIGRMGGFLILTHIDDTRTHAHTHLKENFEN